MWKICSAQEIRELLPLAIELMSDVDNFYEAMLRVVYEWKNSCDANLSNKGMNRVAWIGQSACAIHSNIPEEVTRVAWQELTDLNRHMANEKAELAIKVWEQNKRKELCQKNQLELMF